MSIKFSAVKRSVFDFGAAGKGFLFSSDTIDMVKKVVDVVQGRSYFIFDNYKNSWAIERLFDNAELLGKFIKLIECLFQSWKPMSHVRFPSVYENFVNNVRAELLNKCHIARWVIEKPVDGLFGNKGLVLCPDSLFGVDFDDEDIRKAWYGFSNAWGLLLAMFYYKHKREKFVNKILQLFVSSIKALAVWLFSAVDIPWDSLNQYLSASALYEFYLSNVFEKRLSGLDFCGGIMDVDIDKDPRKVLDWGYGVLGIIREVLPDCSFDLVVMRKKGADMSHVFELLKGFLHLWDIEYNFDIGRLVKFRIEKGAWYGALDFGGAFLELPKVELVDMDDVLFWVAMNRFEEGLLDINVKVRATVDLLGEMKRAGRVEG
jgi:hypothetical protein